MTAIVPTVQKNLDTEGGSIHDEEAFRDHANSGWNEKFFNVKALENVKIYQVDFARYCQEWGIQGQIQSESVDAPELKSQLATAQDRNLIAELEAQLADAQKQADNRQTVHEWNKKLHEENKGLSTKLVPCLWN